MVFKGLSINIPQISLKELTSNPNTNISLLNILRDIGCFYLTDHGIPSSMIAQAFNASKEFFRYPDSLKSKITINKDHRGWLKQESNQYREILFFGPNYTNNEIYPDIPYKSYDLIANNQWPLFMNSLENNISPYYNSIQLIGDQLLSILAKELHLPSKFFNEYYKSPLIRAQLVYYPSNKLNHSFGVFPHTDNGVFTLLQTNNVSGLQFYHELSNKWINVPPIKDNFIINMVNYYPFGYVILLNQHYIV